jgi:hypothetical protein
MAHESHRMGWFITGRNKNKPAKKAKAFTYNGRACASGKSIDASLAKVRG